MSGFTPDVLSFSGTQGTRIARRSVGMGFGATAGNVTATLLLRVLILLALAWWSLLFFSASAGAAQNTAFPRQIWSFDRLLGGIDRSSAQRGLQVYREVCSSCHSLKFVAYRNLADLGYSPDDIKAFASEFEVETIDDNTGERVYRAALPSDRFVSPWLNDIAARAANNGALPPDLSLIVKARKSGADRLYSILTGYQDAPQDFEVGDGLYYNRWFDGNQIAMAPPLTDGQVTYADGTVASVDQMARDVVMFLAWTSEPSLEKRKSLGIKVILFLFVFTVLAYINKRRVWQGAAKSTKNAGDT